MSELGETRKVWHVIGPGGKNQPGAWWCFESREQAERQAGRMKRSQISEGTETLSELGNGLRFWDVRRPSPLGSAT